MLHANQCSAAVAARRSTTQALFRPVVLVLVLLLLQNNVVLVDGRMGSNGICTSPSGTFTVEVDLHASELGYFRFKECGNVVNPTIGIELGRKYTFTQFDRSNWFHPMGFAYFPDGALDDQPELEPTVDMTGSGCAATYSCPHPRYFVNGEFAGVDAAGPGDFGLDVYEPAFMKSPDWYADWYQIELRFDDFTYGRDIFYFCHIHQYMSGRIKLLRNGEPILERNRPRLGYQYDPPPSEFDAKCGTWGLEDFQTPGNPMCPDRFVCGTSGTGVEHFASCIDAMNCHMLDGMTTGISSQDPVTLFVHQMVPHHQNAVNMAKALLKEQVLVCDDLAAGEADGNQDCIMELVLRDIVNTQNHQIQLMMNYLKAFELPETDNCMVVINTLAKIIEGPADYNRDNGIIAGLVVEGPPPDSTTTNIIMKASSDAAPSFMDISYFSLHIATTTAASLLLILLTGTVLA